MDISQRKRLILQKIVLLYTMSGDPVGSKLLNELLDEISVSSATIRNEMLELTNLGLLAQPHTSAGRVPTVEGYRYYVDHLLRIKPVSDAEKADIDASAADIDSDPDKAAEQAAKLLADITGLAAIATTPKGGNVQITHFDLIRSGRYNLAVLGVTSVGGVKSRVCRVAEDLTDQQVDAVAAVLNDHLVFVSAEDATPELVAMASSLLGNNAALFAPILSAAVALIKSASEVKIYTEGQQHLLAYQELDGHLKSLLELFADSEAMQKRMNLNGTMRVYVGGAFDLENLGVVMDRYRAAGGRYGALAVAGPVRMDYGYIIPRLSYFRDKLSLALTNPGT